MSQTVYGRKALTLLRHSLCFNAWGLASGTRPQASKSFRAGLTIDIELSTITKRLQFVVLSMISLIISLPSLTASGNRGAKYRWMLSNRSRYASNAPNETHSDHA